MPTRSSAKDPAVAGQPFHRAWKGVSCLLILLFVLSCVVPVVEARVGGDRTMDVGRFADATSADGVPAGWRLQPYKGRPQLAIERAGGRLYLRLTSAGHTAYGVRKNLRIDLRRYPYLNWTWKAVRLPRGGDIRKRAADDQVLQVYIAFAAGGLSRLLTPPAIAYIWDNLAPKGLKTKSPQPLLEGVRYIVIRNGSDPRGVWYTEKRHVLADYRELIAGEGQKNDSPMVEGILLFINTHKTGSEAEGCIGDIFFSGE